MQSIDFDDALEKIAARDARYDREAYRFVRDALDFTQQLLARNAERPPRAGRKPGKKSPPHHVSGRELLDGIREHALKEFGPMVVTVFEAWGIRQTTDFGEIVFNMVEAGLLNKTAEDSRADFEGVYDFKEAFEQPFRPGSKSDAANSAPLPPRAN